MQEGTSNKGQPAIFGIDFGSYYLKIAAWGSDSQAIIVSPSSDVRLPFLVQFADNGAESRVLGLKQTLGQDNLLDTDPVAQIGKAIVGAMGLYNGPVSRDKYCVATVPFRYSERQRAGFLSSLRAIFDRTRFINEDQALLFGCENQITQASKVLVYHMGAGPFWCGFYGRERSGWVTLGQDTDTSLGGNSLDSMLLSTVIRRLPEGQRSALLGSDAFSQLASRIEIYRKGERKKPLRFGGATGSKFKGSSSLELLPETIEELMKNMFSRSMAIVGEVLNGGEADAVLVSGGISKSGLISASLKEQYGDKLVEVPDSAVALGAAVFGSKLTAAQWLNEAGRQSLPKKVPSKGKRARKGKNRWLDIVAADFDAAQEASENGDANGTIQALVSARKHLDGLTANVYLRFADMLEVNGELDNAIQFAEAATMLHPEDRHIAIQLARYTCSWAKSRRFSFPVKLIIDRLEATEKVLHKHLSGHDAGSVIKHLAAVLHLKAVILVDSKRSHEALKILEKCLEYDPHNPDYIRDFESIRSRVSKKRVGKRHGIAGPGTSRQPRRKPR